MDPYACHLLAAAVVLMTDDFCLGTHKQETTAIAAAMMNTGRPTARMDVEVNDYQPSGPNNRHDPPKGPGRT
jgi:hypothetical protein